MQGLKQFYKFFSVCRIDDFSVFFAAHIRVVVPNGFRLGNGSDHIHNLFPGKHFFHFSGQGFVVYRHKDRFPCIKKRGKYIIDLCFPCEFFFFDIRYFTRAVCAVNEYIAYFIHDFPPAYYITYKRFPKYCLQSYYNTFFLILTELFYIK